MTEQNIRENYPEAIRMLADQMPDAYFEDLPEIALLKEAEAQALEEYRKLSAPLTAQTQQLEDLAAHIDRLNQEKEKALIKFQGKSMGDFLRGDVDFSSAVEERENLQRLEWRIEAATVARATIRQQTEGGALREQVDAAGSRCASLSQARGTRLLQLKLEAALSTAGTRPAEES